MDLVGAYSSGGESDGEQRVDESASLSAALRVSAAPDVTDEADRRVLVDVQSNMLLANVRYGELPVLAMGPVQPADAARRTLRLDPSSQHVITGYVEPAHMASSVFAEQHDSFVKHGFASDPTGSGRVVGNVQRFMLRQAGFAAENESIDEESAPKGPPPEAAAIVAGFRKNRRAERDKPQQQQQQQQPGVATVGGATLATATAAGDAMDVSGGAQAVPASAGAGAATGAGASSQQSERSTLHARKAEDFQGRSWFEPEPGYRPHEPEAFVPKKQCAGLDGKCKVWDATSTLGGRRSYMGHQKAVRDVCFSNDGTRFLSTAFDNAMKEWDTETGQCVSRFTASRYCPSIKYNPRDNTQFIVACQNKKLLQYDTRTKDCVLEYTQHMAPVNTVTFIDNGKRFVSSSDDKTLRIWDWGVPVVIKYISEPHMHSMPAVRCHPGGEFFSCQSLDNKIITYMQQERFAIERRKIFSGHSLSGFACQHSFSADGRFVSSGDSIGRVITWEWDKPNRRTVLAAHSKVTIDVEWHPWESKLATCSWDGSIKYWS